MQPHYWLVPHGKEKRGFYFMKKSFILHLDSLEILDELSMEQAGELLFAMRDYNIGNSPNLSGLMKAIFVTFKNQFDRDLEKYKASCLKNRGNGSKGGRPIQTQVNPVGYLQTQVNPNEPDNDSDSDSDNESNIIQSAETDVQNVQRKEVVQKTKGKTSLPALTIEERKLAFRDSLAPHLEKYGKDTLNSFYSYWTQITEGSRKLHFEKQTTWDVRYRLSTWIKNERVNKFAPAPYVRPAQNTNAMMSQDNHSNYADYVAWCKKNNVTPEKEEI